MTSTNIMEEPNTAPPPNQWYNLSLGSSFKDHQPSSKFCSLRYEFKPASIDKSQPGTLVKNKENRVTVEFQNNQHGRPKVSFEGSSEDYKETDAVLFFDGESFRLEQLHRAVKRLRHVRLPGDSVAAATTSSGPVAESSPPLLGKPSKFQASNKSVVPQMPVEVERIEVGNFKNLDSKPRNEKVVDHQSPRPNSVNLNYPSASPNPVNVNYPPASPNPGNFNYPSASPKSQSTPPDHNKDELEEQLDILFDDDDDNEISGAAANIAEKEYHTGIDINIPTHQNDMDIEIADIDASDDDLDKGRNAAEALRAQVNAEERREQTSSSSGSSGSESSGSGSGSGSASGSGSGSSSSDSESSDADSVTSI